MKKHTLIAALSLLATPYAIASTNLVQVYEQALISDPTYQQTLAQQLAIKEGTSISLASLLPAAAIQVAPSVTKTTNSGNTEQANHLTTKAYKVSLTLTQTLFDFAKFSHLSGAKAQSKQADAKLNAALQNLMLRTAQAYFTVLKDEETLNYNQANKEALAKQLDQINQQYKVGLKTITDVYTAEASYDTANAGYIAAQATLENDKENLRVMTGNTYTSMAKLDENFPLISPNPADIDAWVTTAINQNWAIKAAQYANQNALTEVKQQSAGHLPTLNTQGEYDINYSRNTAGSDVNPAGTSKSRDMSVALTLNIPVFQGGYVVASTKKAKYNYQASTQLLEQTLRSTISTTRQSYLNILSGIQQVKADKQAVKSAISSLEGMKEGYHVGTQTLVDVLNQQQKVFQTETNYAADRYSYVMNLLALKQAAGTLNQQDLEAVNAWLIDVKEHDPVAQSSSAHNIKTTAKHPHQKTASSPT